MEQSGRINTLIDALNVAKKEEEKAKDRREQIEKELKRLIEEVEKSIESLKVALDGIEQAKVTNKSINIPEVEEKRQLKTYLTELKDGCPTEEEENKARHTSWSLRNGSKQEIIPLLISDFKTINKGLKLTEEEYRVIAEKFFEKYKNPAEKLIDGSKMGIEVSYEVYSDISNLLNDPNGCVLRTKPKPTMYYGK